MFNFNLLKCMLNFKYHGAIGEELELYYCWGVIEDNEFKEWIIVHRGLFQDLWQFPTASKLENAKVSKSIAGLLLRYIVE